MLMISSRGSATDVSDVDAIRDVVLEDPSPDVDNPLSEADYLAAPSGRKVLMLVHGYNKAIYKDHPAVSGFIARFLAGKAPDRFYRR